MRELLDFLADILSMPFEAIKGWSGGSPLGLLTQLGLAALLLIVLYYLLDSTFLEKRKKEGQVIEKFCEEKRLVKVQMVNGRVASIKVSQKFYEKVGIGTYLVVEFSEGRFSRRLHLKNLIIY
jgi:hypothetical protein